MSNVEDLISSSDSIQVFLNGVRWNKTQLSRSNTNEAMLIIFGLSPGIYYELELKWLGKKVKTDFSTDDKDIPTISPLESTLASTISLKDTLTLELKRARKDSQRQTAALQSEIDAIKRSLERSTPSDQRSKQKVLALQESVKKSDIAAVEMEEEIKIINETLPILESDYLRIKSEWKTLSEQVKISDKVTNEAIEFHNRNKIEKKQKINNLDHKFDKLTIKKDKLDHLIPELEKKLVQLDKEIEITENELTLTTASDLASKLTEPPNITSTTTTINQPNLASTSTSSSFNRVISPPPSNSQHHHHHHPSGSMYTTTNPYDITPVNFSPFESTFPWSTNSPTDNFALPFPSTSFSRPSTSDRPPPAPIGRPQTHTISEPFNHPNLTSTSFAHVPSLEAYSRRRTTSGPNTSTSNNNNNNYFRNLI